MRRPILVAVLVFAAVAALANLGFELVGAMRQIDTLAGASAGTANSAISAALRATQAASAPLVSRAPSAETAVEPTAATRELPLPVPESEPHARFDAEAALREAGDRDPNVADLSNDPDPAVGSAVRDFITHLDSPGGQ